MKPQYYADVAAVVLAAEGIFAVVHRLVGAEYAGFTHAHNVVIDTALACVWFGGALALMWQRTFPAFFLVVLAMFSSLVHGAMFSVTSRAPYGLPFLLATALGMYCIVHAAPAWDAPHPSAKRRMRAPRPRHA